MTRAIDYSKGCYLGQEPIVRIRDRGHTQLAAGQPGGRRSGAGGRGDRLEADIKPKAGRITSVAALPGQPAVALGMLHMSVPVGTPVRIEPAGEGAPRRAGNPGIRDVESPRTLDSQHPLLNSPAMGKHDNRRSMKMRRRISQKKLKARLKRRKTERAAPRTGSTKAPSKKKAAAKE